MQRSSKINRGFWRIFWKEEATSNVLSLFHHAVCVTTCPQPHPQRVLHTVRYSTSTFNLEYSLLSLRSSRNCLHLLPPLPVTIIFQIIISSRCFGRLPTQNVTSSISLPSFYRSNRSFPSFSSTTFQNFGRISIFSISEVSNFQRHTILCSKTQHFTSFFLKFKSSLMEKLFSCFWRGYGPVVRQTTEWKSMF
jgi:hypothetical protein